MKYVQQRENSPLLFFPMLIFVLLEVLHTNGVLQTLQKFFTLPKGYYKSQHIARAYTVRGRINILSAR